jgi:hypothetical protein
MGWRQIVLVGIDLYDKRYFWLPPNEMRTYEKSNMTLTSSFICSEKIISMLGSWGKELKSKGIELTVFNPKSLLADVLPKFDRNQININSDISQQMDK